jgi:hypothetical protein
MTKPGKKAASMQTTVDTGTDMISPMQKILATVLRSSLPQYWDARIVSAEASPKYKIFKMNWTCPAREAAERTV